MDSHAFPVAKVALYVPVTGQRRRWRRQYLRSGGNKERGHHHGSIPCLSIIR